MKNAERSHSHRKYPTIFCGSYYYHQVNPSSFSGGLVCCNIDANCSSKLGSQTQSIDADYSVHILDHAQASFYEIKDKCQAGVTEGS